MTTHSVISRATTRDGVEHLPRLLAIPEIDNCLERRAQVWSTNRMCCSCGMSVERPEVGAIAPTATGPRLAHIGDCHRAALDTHEHHVPIYVACGRLTRTPRLELVR